jgi:hypothetical protein
MKLREKREKWMGGKRAESEAELPKIFQLLRRSPDVLAEEARSR